MYKGAHILLREQQLDSMERWGQRTKPIGEGDPVAPCLYLGIMAASLECQWPWVAPSSIVLVSCGTCVLVLGTAFFHICLYSQHFQRPGIYIFSLCFTFIDSCIGPEGSPTETPTKLTLPGRVGSFMKQVLMTHHSWLCLLKTYSCPEMCPPFPPWTTAAVASECLQLDQVVLSFFPGCPGGSC